MKKRSKILMADIILLGLIFLLIGQWSVKEWSVAVLGKSETDMEKKKIALTFDDGPNADYTETLLEGLRQRDVKVTFFLLGEEAEKYPDIVEDIHADGHLIGVHAYEHVNLSSLSDEKAVEQVEKTKKIIYDITGEQAEFIRPPYGCWKKNLDEEKDMIEVLWDVDPRDWASTSSAEITRRVVSKVQENDIILLHDASQSSVNAAFAIIDELKKEGYDFVTVENIVFD